MSCDIILEIPSKNIFLTPSKNIIPIFVAFLCSFLSLPSCNDVPTATCPDVIRVTYDFESNGDQGWKHAKKQTACQDPLTKYIIPDGGNPSQTYKILSFSTTMEVELKFDFYELGTWDGTDTNKGPDSLEVEINGETIDLGTYQKKDVNEVDPETSQNGFTVTRASDPFGDLCSGSKKDQIHHFSIKFPGTKLDLPLGEIKVTFKPDLTLDAGYTDVAGFDNVKIITNDCDSDHDGVSNLVDRCSNTEAGATVEEVSPKRDIGCSAEQILARDCPSAMDTHEYVYCVMNKSKKLMNRNLMVKALQDELIDDMCH